MKLNYLVFYITLFSDLSIYSYAHHIHRPIYTQTYSYIFVFVILLFGFTIYLIIILTMSFGLTLTLPHTHTHITAKTNTIIFLHTHSVTVSFTSLFIPSHRHISINEFGLLVSINCLSGSVVQYTVYYFPSILA